MAGVSSGASATSATRSTGTVAGTVPTEAEAEAASGRRPYEWTGSAVQTLLVSTLQLPQQGFSLLSGRDFLGLQLVVFCSAVCTLLCSAKRRYELYCVAID